MKYGAKLKSKTGLDLNRDEFFYVYDAPGGTKIGAVKESTFIGTFEKTVSKLLTDYAYVKLNIPLTYNGKSYQYGYVRQATVYEYTPSLTTYYVKPTTPYVNVRSSATAASSKNLIGSLKANALVGTTDGTTENGFFHFTLATGKTGWVSRNYITSTVPAGVTPKVTPGTNVDPTSNPANDSVTERAETTLENTVGSTWLTVIKWVGITVVALAIGIAVAKLYERKK